MLEFVSYPVNIVETGNPVEASIKILNPNYQGAAQTAVRVNLFRSNGSTVDVDDLMTGDNGNKNRYENLEPGPYRIIAEATLEDGKSMTGQGVFVVRPSIPSNRRPRPISSKPSPMPPTVKADRSRRIPGNSIRCPGYRN